MTYLLFSIAAIAGALMIASLVFAYQDHRERKRIIAQVKATKRELKL